MYWRGDPDPVYDKERYPVLDKMMKLIPCLRLKSLKTIPCKTIKKLGKS